MKITAVIVRLLMGALFAFSAIAFFLNLFTPPPMEGDFLLFFQGVSASVYMLPTIKAIELACAVALLTNRFVPLAVVVLFPIVLNILLMHSFLKPEGVPVGLFVVLGDLFLAYRYRSVYAPLFNAKN